MKKTPLRRKSSIRRKYKIAGHESVADIKQDIQDLLRHICIKRDKKCILHGLRCNHEVGMEGIVWQADHLIERSNSATYADSRLVVLICRNCHGWKHFTKSNHDQYDEWVRTKLPPEHVELWDACRENKWHPHHAVSYDWKLSRLALQQELLQLA